MYDLKYNNAIIYSFQFAAAVTTPFDVVKTIRQIELTEREIIIGW